MGIGSHEVQHILTCLALCADLVIGCVCSSTEYVLLQYGQVEVTLSIWALQRVEPERNTGGGPAASEVYAAQDVAFATSPQDPREDAPSSAISTHSYIAAYMYSCIVQYL